MKYLFHYLLAGTRGGATRTDILRLISKTPMNTNKIAEKLKLDYKTVQHHLKVLEENGVISTIKKGSYGALYHLSPEAEANIETLKEIWGESGKK